MAKSWQTHYRISRQDQKIYYCWDSTADVTTAGASTDMKISKQTEIENATAATLMSAPYTHLAICIVYFLDCRLALKF